MAKDINIHLKTTGADKTKQDLDRTGQSGKDLGSDIQSGSEHAKQGLGKVDGASRGTKRELNDLGGAAKDVDGKFGGFAKRLAGWASEGVVIAGAIAAVTKSITMQSEALKEHGRIAAEQQKSLTNLQYLGDFFEKHPEARKEVAAYAEYGRRDFADVAGAWYALESKGAGLSESQKQGIMKESLELGRQEPNADLTGIVEMFSLYMKETQEQDVNLVQNIIRETVTTAGAEMSQVGQLMPRFLSIGMSGGLTGPQAAGLWAFATTKTKEASEATTGLRNIFLALEGQGTPESQELIAGLGIAPEMGFFEKLERLAEGRRQGGFALPEAEKIAGKESAAILLSMLVDTKAMIKTISTVSGAARPDVDIVGEQLQTVLAADEFARLEEEGRRLDVVLDNIKGQSLRGLRSKVVWDTHEAQRRKEGASELGLWADEKIYDFLVGAGLPPEWAVKATGPMIPSTSHIDRYLKEMEEQPVLEPSLQSTPPREVPIEGMPPAESPPPVEARPLQRQPETVGPGPAREPSESPPALAPQPTPTPPPSDEPPVVYNVDHRVFNYTIHNPVAGMNKQDLGIEPPRLSV